MSSLGSTSNDALSRDHLHGSLSRAHLIWDPKQQHHRKSPLGIRSIDAVSGASNDTITWAQLGARATTPYQETTWTAVYQELTCYQPQQHRNRSSLGIRRNDTISRAHLGTDATTPYPIAHLGSEAMTPYREFAWDQTKAVTS